MNQSWPSEPQGLGLEHLMQLFKALGDPSRMKILFLVGSSEACVSEIASKLNMSESAVSHHLHILRMNGLVRWRREGKTILWQHRTIWQEHSAKDFASYESYKRAGILYVFPPFITARMGQKIGRRPQTQLCGDALYTMEDDHVRTIIIHFDRESFCGRY